MGRITLRRPDLAKHAWRVFAEIARRNPAALEAVVTNIVIYLHVYPFSRYVMREIDARLAALDAGTWVQPPILAPEAESRAAGRVGKVPVEHFPAVA